MYQPWLAGACMGVDGKSFPSPAGNARDEPFIRWGRVSYISWLEARAANDGGKIDEIAMQATRSGWDLGEGSFKDKLLGLIDKAGARPRKKGDAAGAAVRAHGESETERIIGLVGAALVKAHTSMNNDWLDQRLCMGDPTAISQLLNRVRIDAKSRKILKMHGKIFRFKD